MSRMQGPFPGVETPLIQMMGGLNLASPATLIKPGFCIDATNYEIDSVNGGYQRINGYERFDGRTEPSSAPYSTLTFSGAAPAVGTTVTGGTSGATGKVLAVAGATLVLGRVSGSFVSGESLGGGATSTSSATQSGASDPATDAAYNLLAANDRRADIQAVPGSGRVLGVWIYNDNVYAFRNNAGGTAAVMHKATAGGWSAIAMPYEIPYSVGHKAPADGTALYGMTSAATATARRTINRTGSWGSTATGVLVVDTITGTFSSTEVVASQASATITMTIASPAVITWTGHGLVAGEAVVFTTTGALPTGVTAGTVYYVLATGLTANTFQIAATQGGTVINTSGVQSGTHTGRKAYVTSSATATQITLQPSGSFEFVNYNFTGSTATYRMYGCDGVNPAFEFDGTTFVKIRTGMATDTPTHIAAHKNYLHLAFKGSSQNSSIGDPYGWSLLTGSSEIGTGDDITGYLPQPGDASTSAMAIFTKTTTKTLYGSTPSDWKLVTASPTTGAAAGTMQFIGTAFCLAERGIQQISNTIAFGDFQFATVSGLIQSLINQKIGTTTASAAYKTRNQYRVFFSDSSAISMTVSGNKVSGFMPIQYDKVVRCYVVANKSDGKEYCYFGSDDGYVYRDNVGTSFDGNAIEAWLRLPFSHFGSPSYRKRFRRAVLDLVVTGYSQLSVSYELGGGNPDVSPGVANTITGYGAGGYWNQFTWDQFVWDSPLVNLPSISLEGTEKSISLLFYSNSNVCGQHSIGAVTFHLSLRRLDR